MALQYTIAASTVAGLALFWYDFQSWKSFGTGGTPPTLRGYLKIRRFGIYLFFKPQDPCDISRIPDTGPSYLDASSVPKRTGPRPRITRWTLPQRQHAEPITATAQTTLSTMMQDITSNPAYSPYIRTAPSKTEGGTGAAIYARTDVAGINLDAKKVFCELAHVHPAENSLHVYVAPRDARTVVERGWAQMFAVPWMTPPSWLHVYAPRDEKEVEVVREIVRAAVCFAAGKQV